MKKFSFWNCQRSIKHFDSPNKHFQHLHANTIAYQQLFHCFRKTSRCHPYLQQLINCHSGTCIQHWWDNNFRAVICRLVYLTGILNMQLFQSEAKQSRQMHIDGQKSSTIHGYVYLVAWLSNTRHAQYLWQLVEPLNLWHLLELLCKHWQSSSTLRHTWIIRRCLECTF